jgi:hypothetical protein
MTTLVMAHGGRDPKLKELKVPAGMTIDYYAEFDENMFFVNGLAVLARGDAGTPTQSYSAGDPMPNYFYQALNSDQLGWYLQLDRSGIPAWFVGNDLPDNTYLCSDYEDCHAWGANDGSGYHSCDGVLGKAHAAGETHLAIFACRGNMAQATRPGSRGIRSEDGTNDTSHMDEMQSEVQKFAALGRPEQEAAWNSWPEGTRTLLMTFPWMKSWADAYGAKQLLVTDGIASYEGYTTSLNDVAKAFLANDPGVMPAYAKHVVAYLGSDPVAATQWFDTQPEDRRLALCAADEGLTAWMNGRVGDEARADTTWEPTEGDYAAVNSVNQSYVKEGAEDVDHPWMAGGFLVLLGDEHPASFTDWVRGRPDFASGTFEIGRATFGAGKITVTGAPASHQDTITWAVGQFSDKTVKFA